MDDETRAIPETEFRADAEQGTFDGHAAAFRFVDDYGTAFLKGAFRKTINDHKLEGGGSRIPAVWFHDPAMPVGPVVSLKEDDKGLRFTAKAIDDGATGSMVLAHLRGGTPLGMSFSFRRIKDRSAEDIDGIDLTTGPKGIKKEDVRVITEAAVREISPLLWTFAAQPMAQITDIRSRMPSLLDALRTGRLSDEDGGLIEQLVIAWNARAAAGETHGTPEQVRRNRTVELESLFMNASPGVRECLVA